MFEDRMDAGEKLAYQLRKFKDKECVILGIPKGGVVVAKKVAEKINAKLDIVITKKVGAPYNPEVAVGAVNENGDVFWDERLMKILGVMPDLLEGSVKEAVKEIERRSSIYRDGKTKINLTDKNVILVDDGIATGFTILAAIKSIKDQNPLSIALAVPVTSKDALDKLENEVNEIIRLEVSDDLQNVAQFYEEFEEVEDEKVIELLKSGE